MLTIRNHQVTRHETKRGVQQHQLSKCYLLLSNIFYHILEKKGTQDTEVGKKACYFHLGLVGMLGGRLA